MVTGEAINPSKEKDSKNYEAFEKNPKLCALKIEFLALKNHIKETWLGEKKEGSHIGRDNHSSFLFKEPYDGVDKKTYLILTLNGYRGISFPKSEEGKLEEEKFQKSIERHEEFYRYKRGEEGVDAQFDSSDSVLAQLLGYNVMYNGKETYRIPDAQASAFSVLNMYPLEKDIDLNIIELVENNS